MSNKMVKNVLVNLMKEKMNKLRKFLKESRKETLIGIQSLILFLCLLFAVHLGDTAIEASSAYGDRELPIYCVDTEENKISISFDAAWVDGSLMEEILLIKYYRKVCLTPLF